MYRGILVVLLMLGGCFGSDGDSGGGDEMGGSPEESIGSSGAPGGGDGDGDGDGTTTADGDQEGLGVVCGDTTCPEGRICCDRCKGFCADPNTNIACPDDIDPGRECPTGDGDGDGDAGVECAPGAAGKACATGAAPCCDGLVYLQCDAGCTGSGSCFGTWVGVENEKLCSQGIGGCTSDADCKGGLCCPGPLGDTKSCMLVDTCPGLKCNSPDTPIATPEGERPVADLAVGDLVYSMHGGRLTAVPVIAVRSLEVSNHAVVRVELVNGNTLRISGTHPTADGRTLADLVAGDVLGDVEIVSVSMVPYEHERTYDILPASDTGTYLAGGALISSTLFGGER